MPSRRSTSPNIQYCPWCPQVIAFPLAPGEATSCLSTLTEHVMRYHLGRLVNTKSCVKIDSPHVDTHGPGDTGSGGGFGKAYIPAEYIYAYMCPVRKVFVNVYKDPMDGMWYRLKLRCECAECADEAETEHIEHKVERDEGYWADEEEQKGVSELAINAKNVTGGCGGISVDAAGVRKGDD